MRKYCVYLKFNATLVVGMITLLLPHIFSLEYKRFPTQRYDYIDVAKETATDLSKGLTTRIFTAENDLDENFWLKYLGEDFRDAVHLRVDYKNNVVRLENQRPQHQQQRQQLNYNTGHENLHRVVRQPTQENNKQLPVENVYRKNKKYPTEKPEIFNINPNKTFWNNAVEEYTSTNHFKDNRKISQNHNKPLTTHNKHIQKITKFEPIEKMKTIPEPIVVNFPEVENCEYQINEDNVPVVVQLPPVIYHQKADLYSENMSNLQYFMHKNNLNTDLIPDSPLDKDKNSIQNTPKYTTHSHNTPSNTHNREEQYEHHSLTHYTDYDAHNQMKLPYPYQAH